jgi:antitoxin HicB
VSGWQQTRFLDTRTLLSESSFTYPAKFSTGSDGRVLVEFVDLPRVATDGASLQEAIEEAIDALGSDLSIRLSREEIPAPSHAKRGQRLVPVPWWLVPKLALHLAMLNQGVDNSELARRLKVDERVVRRMRDPAHETKAEKIQAVLALLGKRLSMEVEDAA